MCVTTNGDERIQGRRGLMLYFFLHARDIFFTQSFIFFFIIVYVRYTHLYDFIALQAGPVKSV